MNLSIDNQGAFKVSISVIEIIKLIVVLGVMSTVEYFLLNIIGVGFTFFQCVLLTFIFIVLLQLASIILILSSSHKLLFKINKEIEEKKEE